MVFPEVIINDLIKLIDTYDKYVINTSSTLLSYTQTDLNMIREVSKFTKIQAYDIFANDLEFMLKYNQPSKISAKKDFSSPAWTYYVNYFNEHYNKMRDHYLEKLEKHNDESLYILATVYHRNKQYKRMIWCYVTITNNGDLNAAKILGDFYKSNGLIYESEKYYAISMGLESIAHSNNDSSEIKKELEKITESLDNLSSKMSDLDYNFDTTTKSSEGLAKMIENNTQLILNDIAETDDTVNEIKYDVLDVNDISNIVDIKVTPMLKQIIENQQQSSVNLTAISELENIPKDVSKLENVTKNIFKDIDKSVNTKFNDIIHNIHDVEDDMIGTMNDIGDDIVKKIRNVADRIDNLTKSMETMKSCSDDDKLKDMKEEIVNSVCSVENNTNAIIDMSEIAMNKLDNLEKIMKTASSSDNDAVMKEINNIHVVLKNLASAYEKLESVHEKCDNELAVQDKQIYKQQKQIDDCAVVANKLCKQVADLIEERKSMNNELSEKKFNVDKYIDVCDKQHKQIEESTDMIDEYKTQLTNMADRNKALEILVSQQQRQLEENTIIIDKIVKQEQIFLATSATKMNEYGNAVKSYQQQIDMQNALLKSKNDVIGNQQKQINELIELNKKSQTQVDALLKSNESMKEFTIV